MKTLASKFLIMFYGLWIMFIAVLMIMPLVVLTAWIFGVSVSEETGNRMAVSAITGICLSTFTGIATVNTIESMEEK